MTMKAGGGWMPRVGGREELKEMEKTGPEQHVHFIFHLLKILKSKRDLVDISIIFSLFIFGFFFFPLEVSLIYRFWLWEKSLRVFNLCL